MRTDVIDQVMAVALHPAFDCKLASTSLILCLTRSPEAHPHLVRRKVVEDMLEICCFRQMLVSEQSPQPQVEMEHPLAVKTLQ